MLTPYYINYTSSIYLTLKNIMNTNINSKAPKKILLYIYADYVIIPSVIKLSYQRLDKDLMYNFSL